MPQTFTFTWQYAVTVGSAETLATPVYWIPYSTHLIVPDQTVQLVAGTEPYAADLTFRRSVSTPPTLGNNIRTSATNLTGGPANWQLGGARYDTYPDQIQWPGVGPVSVPAGQYLQASIVANISDVPAGFSVSIVGDYLDPTITLQWCLPYGSEQTFGPWPNAFSIGGPLGQNLYAASAATTGNGLGYTPNATLYLDHPDGSSETIAGPSLILGTGQPGPIWPLTTPVTVRVGDKLRTVANSAAMSATPPGCMVVTFALQPPAPPPPLVFPSNPNVGDNFEDWHWDGTAWRCGTYVPPTPPQPKTIIIPVGTTSWVPPPDFDHLATDTVVECWGAGGGAAGAYSSVGSAGGGGRYQKTTGAVQAGNVPCQVGAGGAGSVGNLSSGGGPAGTKGGDTFFGGTQIVGSHCGAEGGYGGLATGLNTGASGGGQGGQVGYSDLGGSGANGGDGGYGTALHASGGGGGAGGPHGAGLVGVNSGTTYTGAAGGAGDNGQGGAGGTALSGAQGTAGAGADHDNGGGGGGGMAWAGGTGQVGVGGAGGKPGGGGGAAEGRAQSPTVTGGRGGDGEIRITYTPRA
jgi:hypothetical protein